MNVRRIDRSRIEAAQICEAYRFNRYERDLTGYSPEAASVPLCTGSAIHAGIEMLFSGASPHEAARNAALVYLELAKPHKVPDEHSDAVLREQMALAYGLTYAWALRRRPTFLSRFRVVEIEAEKTVPLGVIRVPDADHLQNGQYHREQARVELMSRADGYLEDEDGLRFVLSLKTLGLGAFPRPRASGEEDWLTLKTRIDNQGLSEMFALAASSGGAMPDGVIMEWLLKGPRKMDDRLNRRVQWSPLLRAWRLESASDPEYAWRYEWDEVDELTGETRKRRRGKGWTGFAVYEELPIDLDLLIELGGATQQTLLAEQERLHRECANLSPEDALLLRRDEEMFARVRLWLHMLDAERVHPFTDVLSQQIVSNTFYRSPQEITEWVDETLAQETRIAQNSLAWRALAPEERPAATHKLFRRSRTACANMYGDICEFYRVCWAGLDPARVGSGFAPRKPHHDQEYDAE